MSLTKEAIERLEGVSNIRKAVNDLLSDGFEKSDIIKYIKRFVK